MFSHYTLKIKTKEGIYYLIASKCWGGSNEEFKINHTNYFTYKKFLDLFYIINVSHMKSGNSRKYQYIWFVVWIEDWLFYLSAVAKSKQKHLQGQKTCKADATALSPLPTAVCVAKRHSALPPTGPPRSAHFSTYAPAALDILYKLFHIEWDGVYVLHILSRQ